MGLLILRLSHDPTKEQQKFKEAKTSNNFTRSQRSRHYNYKMTPARTVNYHFLFILTSKSFPYMRTTRRWQQKEIQKFNRIEVSKNFVKQTVETLDQKL